jgi:hypothetical protein
MIHSKILNGIKICQTQPWRTGVVHASITALCLVMTGFVATSYAQPAPSQPANAAKSAKAPTNVVDPIDIKLERKKVTVAEGKEVLVPATTAKPGEVIEETATYTNPSKKNIRRVEATLPVPQFTEPVLGSITPANVKASTDGMTFAEIPLKRKVRQPNGVVLEQAVPLSEYRFLRWSAIELAPEKKFVASARFRLVNGVNAK